MPLKWPRLRGGGEDRGVRHVHRDIQPAASGSVQQAACWTMAWQRRCLDGPLVCTRRRLLVGARGYAPPVRPVPQKSPCARHCVDVLCSVAAVGLCRATTSDGVRRAGAPRWLRRPPAPADAKRAGRSIGRLLAGEWAASGGWGARAAGRTSTGVTCAISASKRGSSGAQATPLYMQVPAANTCA